MSVEGHGTCLGPEVCAERSLGAASLSGPRWTRLGTPGRRAGQRGATGSTCSTFSETGPSPTSAYTRDAPEIPALHSPDRSFQADGSCCQRWDGERGASTAEGLPCPREGAAAAASQPSEPCLTSELVSKTAMAARQGTGRRRKPREQSAGTNAHGSAPSLPAGAARGPRWQGVCCPTLQACESGLPTAGTGNTTASYVRLRKNHGRSEKSRRSLNIVSTVAFLLWESSLYPVFNTLGPSLPPPNVSPPRLILPSGAPDDPSPPGNTPAY